MTGTNIAVANAGSALLSKIMGGDETVDPFADETKKLQNNYFGFFLNISGKTGDIIYNDGDDEKEIDTPGRFYVNVETMMKGYQCWIDSEPVDTIVELYLNKDALPAERDLPDHGPYGDEDGWSELLGIHMLYENPDGPEDGSEDIPFTYNATSKTGTNAIRLFLKDYMKKIRQHIGEDGQLMIPLVEIDIDNFKSKKKHKIYFPVIEIVDWAERSSFGTAFDFGGGDDEENYDDDGAGDDSGGGDEDDASNYKDDDTTDIDPDTGDEVKDDEPDEKPADKPRGRGRGRARGGDAKAATKHEKPQDSKTDKPAARRGRRGSAK